MRFRIAFHPFNPGEIPVGPPSFLDVNVTDLEELSTLVTEIMYNAANGLPPGVGTEVRIRRLE